MENNHPQGNLALQAKGDRTIPPKAIHPHISVDCVIFGFADNRLRILLVRREYSDGPGKRKTDYKLPGDFITIHEDLDHAASRTLHELTGLKNIFLQQFAVFGQPDRIKRWIDVNWLLETTGHTIHRVVTTAYFALLNISRINRDLAIRNNASWVDIDKIPPLAFDHNEIIQTGLAHLRRSVRFEPLCFELLPAKFTIRELQAVHEAILGTSLDNRNFRKKAFRARYLARLDEKQSGVAHKPAYYYRFEREIYEQEKKDSYGFTF